MKTRFLLLIFLFVVVSCNKPAKIEHPVYDDALFEKIRAASLSIPGELPSAINYLKYAESFRPWKDVVEGGSDERYTMARSIFQVEFSHGWVMIDAGMDKKVHDFFGKDKADPEPFDESKSKLVEQAVRDANLILITHEHGDHVAGVIRNSNDSVARKTIMTMEQAKVLENDPQMPEIKLSAAKTKQFMVAEFESCLAIAPGMVLIKSPGHTAGEIMIYTRLNNGKEFIFTGDVSWSHKGIAELKLKPKSEMKRVGEDPELIKEQLTWLNGLMKNKNITMLISHDDVEMPKYINSGLLGNVLTVKDH